MSNNKNEVPPGVDFTIPSWAGKPSTGLHLDVTKENKLLQKLMIDEKRCYFFGRNPQTCDFAVDHASCSRVHAALMFHKHLNRLFLVDLGSTHGTFIGHVRLEAHKPEQVLIDQSFHFGASQRRYTVRERPDSRAFPASTMGDESILGNDTTSARLLGLPEKEEELENLTEYNTALNRRIATMTVADEDFKAFGQKRKRTSGVKFNDAEDVINPEDVDPSVGRFRNMIQTTVIRPKRPRTDFDFPMHESGSDEKPHSMPGVPLSMTSTHLPGFGPISAKLSMSLPNIAPDVDLYPPSIPPLVEPASPAVSGQFQGPTSADPSAMVASKSIGTHALVVEEEGPKKKKYAKEAWPGKKPGQHLLL